mgnify:CR=1 FL=1
MDVFGGATGAAMDLVSVVPELHGEADDLISLFHQPCGDCGGIHATYNNTLHDGRTIVTGHLHAQQARPFTDAHGTRWGVDLGCLADPTWPQFNYTTANTKNWRSGFAVLEFRAGRLLPPMLASVTDWGDVVLQRNEVLLRAS